MYGVYVDIVLLSLQNDSFPKPRWLLFQIYRGSENKIKFWFFLTSYLQVTKMIFGVYGSNFSQCLYEWKPKLFELLLTTLLDIELQ